MESLSTRMTSSVSRLVASNKDGRFLREILLGVVRDQDRRDSDIGIAHRSKSEGRLGMVERSWAHFTSIDPVKTRHQAAAKTASLNTSIRS